MRLLSPYFSFSTRAESWKKISNGVWDVVIIGGGITGAACARDAQLRGLKTLLIEAEDFASGTSSGSSKLLHGGVRYLKNAEFKLVYTAIQERERLMKLYAPLVQPLQFVFPTFRSRFPPKWMLNLGLHVYDAFSGFKEKHENIGRQTTLDRYPLLQDQNLTGAIVYADAFAEDYRLVIEIVKSAHRAGAECLNRVAAVAFNASGDHHEIRVQDRLSGEEKVLRSRTVINCAGPFSDQIRRLLGLSEKLYLTQGVHFLVPRTKLPIHEAYVINDPHHDRILFAIPWKTTTYLGTTDTPIQKASDAQARAEDLDYVLRLANQFFNLEIRKADVFQSWAAVRPLIKPSTVESASKVSREHEILEEPNGFFHILGGKLTSHREMAEEALDLMQKFFPQARQCSTKELPLQDQEYYGELGDLEQRFGRYAQDVWEWDREKKLDRMRISQSHPVRAAEIYYAIHHEMAIEPIDFLRRRSSLYYETSEPKILEAVISVFKKELAKPEEWARNKMKETLSAYDWDSSGWH